MCGKAYKQIIRKSIVFFLLYEFFLYEQYSKKES